MSRPKIELEIHDWSAIQEAIGFQIGYIEENGLMRTGMGSQGLPAHVERLKRVKETIKVEASKQDHELFLLKHPEIAKEVEGLVCEMEGCSGPISATGCTRVGCLIRKAHDGGVV